ncbi:MAG: adenosine deaminase, partial [Acidimicrobiia bacterium]|nr:adenosine deaminase [Acidimicrobiia bacterium]
PELIFAMGARNGVAPSHSSVAELRAAYEFSSLQEFLDIYYVGAAALRTEQDFYEMALAYLGRAAADGVRRAEMFFDPQTHTARGVPFGVFMNGLSAAAKTARRDLGISADFIMCFLRHLPATAAMETLEAGLEFRDHFIGVGLDSSEVGYPPELFTDVYARARAEGLHVVAHAGEEGPPEYVWSALDTLKVERVDHGVRSLEDDQLVGRLADEQMPLTVCPMSNVRLGGFARLEDHTLPQMLERGLVVSINSDDPAYFGGYVGDNYINTHQALELSIEQMNTIARNSLEATFLPDDERRFLLAEHDAYAAARS